MTSALFTPVQVGASMLQSRMVMAPLTRNRAPGQLPNALMATYYAQRANPQTGAALIISEATPVCAQGHGYADTPGIHTHEQIAAWRPITDAVHAQGGLIYCQLWHVGRISHTSLQPGGAQPVAPSAVRAQGKTVLIEDGVPKFVDVSEPRALTQDELPGVIEQYVSGAKNAIAAGFDGVEIHGANGYLIDQFLRKGSNLRTDDWGGSIANRTRFLQAVCVGVCEAIGAQRVGLRLSPVTNSNDALDDEPQALFEHAAQSLGADARTQGMAFLHLIEGATGADREFNQGAAPFDYRAMRKAWREAGATGAWMVNNSYTLDLSEAALANGADLVAWGRPFIANPDLATRLKTNQPLAQVVRATLYGGGAAGYTDYASLAPLVD